jgi:hypothetical protein
MDLPEGWAGGPAAESRWLGPCLPQRRRKRELGVNGY